MMEDQYLMVLPRYDAALADLQGPLLVYLSRASGLATALLRLALTAVFHDCRVLGLWPSHSAWAWRDCCLPSMIVVSWASRMRLGVLRLVVPLLSSLIGLPLFRIGLCQ
jgi:hypothetical protein